MPETPQQFTVPVAFRRIHRIPVDGPAPQFLCAGMSRTGTPFGVHLVHPDPTYPQLQVTFSDGSMILRAGLQTLVGAMLDRASSETMPTLNEELLGHMLGLRACLAGMQIDAPDRRVTLLDLFGSLLDEMAMVAAEWELAVASLAEGESPDELPSTSPSIAEHQALDPTGELDDPEPIEAS